MCICVSYRCVCVPVMRACMWRVRRRTCAIVFTDVSAMLCGTREGGRGPRRRAVTQRLGVPAQRLDKVWIRSEGKGKVISFLLLLVCWMLCGINKRVLHMRAHTFTKTLHMRAHAFIKTLHIRAPCPQTDPSSALRSTSDHGKVKSRPNIRFTSDISTPGAGLKRVSAAVGVGLR